MRAPNHAVYITKQQSVKQFLLNQPKWGNVKEIKDAVVDECVKGDDCNLTLATVDKKKVWKQHDKKTS